MALEGHVWTVPAVQEESDLLRSVRVQPCIRPVFAWGITWAENLRFPPWTSRVMENGYMLI
jgi:hypothetical protein